MGLGKQTNKQTSPSSSELNFIFPVKKYANPRDRIFWQIPVTILRNKALKGKTEKNSNFLNDTRESQIPRIM